MDSDGVIRWFSLPGNQSLSQVEDYTCRNSLKLIYRLRIPSFMVQIYKKLVRTEITPEIYRNLALLISSDIPLLESLEIVLSSLTGREKNLLKTIKRNLEMGHSFSKSLMASKVSDAFAQNLIRAGEKVGQLANSLEEIALYKEWQREVRSKLVHSLVYPLLLALTIGAVLLVLIQQLVPQLVDFYTLNGIDIPSSLNFLLSCAAFFSQQGDVILVYGACLIPLGAILIKAIIPVRLFVCRFFLKTPIFGTIYSLSYLSEIYRNLSLQLSNHVDLIQALQSLQDNHESPCYPRAIQKTLSRLEAGDSLTVSMQSARLLTLQDASLLGICEKSGKISQGIQIISDKTAKLLQQKVVQFSESIRPALIICFGCLLGAIAYAIFVPMYESISQIQ